MGGKETGNKGQRLDTAGILRYFTLIIIARTMLTVWRARVVGADGATKAVGEGMRWDGERRRGREWRSGGAYVFRWLPTQGRFERHDDKTQGHALSLQSPTQPHTQFAKVLVLGATIRHKAQASTHHDVPDE